MSAWTDYVTNYYNNAKKTNPNYKFKDALKDASKERKKTASVKPVSGGNKVAKRRTRKSRR